MTSFFKKHKRTPAELVTKLGNAFSTLKAGGGEAKVGAPLRRALRPEPPFAPRLVAMPRRAPPPPPLVV